MGGWPLLLRLHMLTGLLTGKLCCCVVGILTGRRVCELLLLLNRGAELWLSVRTACW